MFELSVLKLYFKFKQKFITSVYFEYIHGIDEKPLS